MLVVRHHASDSSPEQVGVVRMANMGKFVDEHVVDEREIGRAHV